MLSPSCPHAAGFPTGSHEAPQPGAAQLHVMADTDRPAPQTLGLHWQVQLIRASRLAKAATRGSPRLGIGGFEYHLRLACDQPATPQCFPQSYHGPVLVCRFLILGICRDSSRKYPWHA